MLRKLSCLCFVLFPLFVTCTDQDSEDLSTKNHADLTVDQFTKQAVPFTKIGGHYSAIDLLINISEASEHDEVLDVACGPGLVAFEFARKVKHVQGIDLTPEMIRQANLGQEERGLKNMAWMVGNVEALPFADDSFSLVITRYSFHHLQSPSSVLQEMVRVCRPGGRILVADVSIPSAKSAAYDAMERIRDPSHVRALTDGELYTLMSTAGLRSIVRAAYPVDVDADELIAGSATLGGADGAASVRGMLVDDVGRDDLGVGARLGDKGELLFSFPIAVVVGTKPARGGGEAEL